MVFQTSPLGNQELRVRESLIMEPVEVTEPQEEGDLSKRKEGWNTGAFMMPREDRALSLQGLFLDKMTEGGDPAGRGRELQEGILMGSHVLILDREVTSPPHLLFYRMKEADEILIHAGSKEVTHSPSERIGRALLIELVEPVEVVEPQGEVFVTRMKEEERDHPAGIGRKKFLGIEVRGEKISLRREALGAVNISSPSFPSIVMPNLFRHLIVSFEKNPETSSGRHL